MKQERTLKQVQVTLRNVENQCQCVLDFMEQLIKDCPEYDTYHKLMDYITLAIYGIDEKIKTL